MKRKVLEMGEEEEGGGGGGGRGGGGGGGGEGLGVQKVCLPSVSGINEHSVRIENFHFSPTFPKLET